jgi:hypothetical protein
MKDDEDSTQDSKFSRLAPALEFLCWVAGALVVILRLINGPAVTSDQYVIQTAMLLLTATSAIGLRLYAILRP